jgi:hypothetical protein
MYYFVALSWGQRKDGHNFRVADAVSHTNQNEFEAEARYGSLECHIQG